MDRLVVGGPLGGSLGVGSGRALCRSDDGGAQLLTRRLVVVVKKDRGECATHVPFNVVAEHAKEDVSADAIGLAMMDGSDLEVDGFDATEGALDRCQALVGTYDLVGRHAVGVDGCADDINAVESSLIGNRLVIAFVPKA